MLNHFFLYVRPKSPGEIWAMAVWGEQFWWHIPAHGAGTHGNTDPALWPGIYHHHNSADLPGMIRGLRRKNQNSVLYFPVHPASSYYKIPYHSMNILFPKSQNWNISASDFESCLISTWTYWPLLQWGQDILTPNSSYQRLFFRFLPK